MIKTTIERFNAKYVISTKHFYDGTPCWEWVASFRSKGYGQFSHTAAHRWSYEYHKGPISDGLQIDHLCRVHGCVNPLHLEAVTLKQNVLRGIGISAQNAKKEFCRLGHQLCGENLHIDVVGARQCLACRRARGRKYDSIRRLANREQRREYDRVRYAAKKKRLNARSGE